MGEWFRASFSVSQLRVDTAPLAWCKQKTYASVCLKSGSTGRTNHWFICFDGATVSICSQFEMEKWQKCWFPVERLPFPRFPRAPHRLARINIAIKPWRYSNQADGGQWPCTSQRGRERLKLPAPTCGKVEQRKDDFHWAPSKQALELRPRSWVTALLCLSVTPHGAFLRTPVDTQHSHFLSHSRNAGRKTSVKEGLWLVTISTWSPTDEERLQIPEIPSENPAGCFYLWKEILNYSWNEQFTFSQCFFFLSVSTDSML